jgi:hypothetical protein
MLSVSWKTIIATTRSITSTWHVGKTKLLVSLLALHHLVQCARRVIPSDLCSERTATVTADITIDLIADSKTGGIMTDPGIAINTGPLNLTARSIATTVVALTVAHSTLNATAHQISNARPVEISIGPGPKMIDPV